MYLQINQVELLHLGRSHNLCLGKISLYHAAQLSSDKGQSELKIHHLNFLEQFFSQYFSGTDENVN
jgi:hypothetical protein